MSGFVVAMQVLGTMQAGGVVSPVPPPAPVVSPVPAVMPAPAPAPAPAGQAMPGVARPAPAVNPYAPPPRYPAYGYPPPAPRWRPPPPPPPKKVESMPRFFARLDLGFGSNGFADNNTLLSESGFGGFRLWSSIDGGYMIHPRIGAGLWMGLNRRLSDPDNSSRLQEVAYFIAAQAPVHLWGSRDFSVQLTPRLGYATGKVELGDDGGGEFKPGVMWGVGASALSYTYHLSGTVSFMRAQTSPPGAVGGDHDYGGLYFALGGIIGG